MGLIVALACTNLANMLIARAANRQKELAIRLSMGAGRFRIVRQMIAEGLSLSLLGGLAGFAFAYVLSVLNSHFTPPTTLHIESLGLDWHVDPVRDGYTPEKAQAFFENLPARLKAATAVSSVALAAQSPFSTEVEPVPMTTVDAAGFGKVVQLVAKQSVGAGYFAELSEPTLAGREFEEHDQRTSLEASTSAALPAVLNQTAKQKLFGNEDAIGRLIRDDKSPYEVVGVIRDFANVDGFKQATLYLPLTSRDFARPRAEGITVIVRADSPSNASRAIRKELASLDPNLNLFNVQTLDAYLERSRAALRFSIQTYSAMGVFGLILAGIGLAGVTAYSVAQRSKEIGIRMALGARGWQILALVLREGAGLVSVGTILGFMGAIGLARIVSALMNVFADALELGTRDPLLLIGAPVLLAIVALLACYVPARRAAKVDPLLALRQE